MTEAEYRRLPEVSRRQHQVAVWLRDAAEARKWGMPFDALWCLRNAHRMLADRQRIGGHILPR